MIGLFLVEGLFAVFGAGAMVNPQLVADQFKIPTLSADGRNEFRAIYGGLSLGVAGALAHAYYTPALRQGACFTIATVLCGMATSRVLSTLLEGKIGRWPLFYFGFEVVGAFLLFRVA